MIWSSELVKQGTRKAVPLLAKGGALPLRKP